MVIPLVALFVGFAVLTIAVSWDATFGPLLDNLANQIRQIRLPLFRVAIPFSGALALAIVATNSTVRRLLGELAQKTAAPVVRMFRATGHAFLYPAKAVEGLAVDVAGALWALRTHVIPAFIAAKIAWISRAIAAIEHRVGGIVIHPPRPLVQHVTNYAKGAFQTIVHTTLDIPWPRIKNLEREGARTWDRLNKLAKRLTIPALAAAVVAALGHLGAGWIRCSKVKKVGKNVCGLDEGLLESLLADTLLIAGTISLVEFAEGLQAGMKTFAPQIQHFWQAD